MSLPRLSWKRLSQLCTPDVRRVLAMQHYPSRGQTSVQEIYRTHRGTIFLKRTSERNLRDCAIDKSSATLAEREYWCFRLAHLVGLRVPDLRLIDPHTTVQEWLDLPDAHHFASSQGKLTFSQEDVFTCALFDWVTGQSDRHDANYLYDFVKQRIVLVDSAHSLLRHGPSLPDYLRIFEAAAQDKLDHPIQSQVASNIKKLRDTQLRRLAPLRSVDERLALKTRCDQAREIVTLRALLQLFRSRT